VTVERLAYRAPGVGNLHPADAALITQSPPDLPAQRRPHLRDHLDHRDRPTDLRPTRNTTPPGLDADDQQDKRLPLLPENRMSKPTGANVLAAFQGLDLHLHPPRDRTRPAHPHPAANPGAPPATSGTTGSPPPCRPDATSPKAYTRPPLPEQPTAGPGPARASPLPAPTFPTMPIPLPRGVLSRCTSRIYTTSIAFAPNSRARLPLIP